MVVVAGEGPIYGAKSVSFPVNFIFLRAKLHSIPKNQMVSPVTSQSSSSRPLTNRRGSSWILGYYRMGLPTNRIRIRRPDVSALFTTDFSAFIPHFVKDSLTFFQLYISVVHSSLWRTSSFFPYFQIVNLSQEGQFAEADKTSHYLSIPLAASIYLSPLAPKILKAVTVKKIINPGNTASHQA